jgi:peptidyl-prolyl cis-trans isomerase C
MKIGKLYLMLAAAGLLAVPAMADSEQAAKPAEVKPAETKAAEAAPAPAEASPAIWDSLPDKIASVDGKDVTKAELIEYVKSQFPNGKIPALFTADAVKELAPQMVESMIRDRLLAGDMEARKFQITPQEARAFLDEELKKIPPQQLQQMTQVLAAQGKTMEQHVNAMLADPAVIRQITRYIFVKSVILKGMTATDEEAKAFYDGHPDYFKEPETVQASHILVKVDANAPEAEQKAAQEKIERIAAELKKDPSAFEEIAKKESDCPSKEQGGVLGSFGRGRMVEEFEKAAFAMKKGEISAPVKTQFGYHIIRCDEEAKSGVVPFEKVKDELKQMLEMQKLQAAEEKYFKTLRETHKVEILIKTPEKPAAEAAPAEKPAEKPAEAAPAK